MATASWKKSVVCASALAPSASAARAQDRPPASGNLPLRAVRLYEAGLGYFERTGRLGKGDGLALPVPTSHLDDALKTLVVIGTDGKTSVAGIEFASSVSPEMGRALAGLPEGDDSMTFPKLMRALKGASVDLKTERETARGRLIDVVEPSQNDTPECLAEARPAAEAKPAGPDSPPAAQAVPCAIARHMTLLLLTERGEIRRFRSADVTSVRPTDPGFAARLGSGLDATSTQGSAVQKKLRVLATSSSDVTVGYVAEAPVWRSSYRLVLDDQGGGMLQGWALVHNDTDEDWKQVRIELVNGQPDSFLFPLTAPRYTRRPLVTPEKNLSTVPQLHGRTVDSMWGGSMWGDTIGDSFGAGGLGLSGVGEGGGGRGEGIGLGSIGTMGDGSGGSTMLSVGNLAAIAPAAGVESGVLFRYALPSPVDLRAHGSALVPFLQRPVSARRIAHFARPDGPARAAARVQNDTGQTLPAGTIAFFADGGFAGEAGLDRTTTGERHIIAFGVDLDVELSTRRKAHRDEARVIHYEKDRLVEHFVRHHQVEYDVINKSGSARIVFLTLPYVKNSRVDGADELDYDTTADKALAVFKIDAKTQRDRKLEVQEGLSRPHPIAELTSKRLAALAAEAKLPADQRAALRAAADRMQEAEARRNGIPKIEALIAGTLGDIQRLRASLAAAGRGTSEAEPFARRVLDAEDRLASLRARAAALRAERDQRVAAATAALSRLPRSNAP